MGPATGGESFAWVLLRNLWKLLNELVNAEDGTSQRWLFTTGMFTTHLG